MITPHIMQGAEPYFHRGGGVGCLVLHGFTASPAEVRWLAQYLGGEGHTVYAPRLAGHGADPTDLARARWRDWYLSALDGVHLLRAQCDRLVLVGHSMGGLLSLLLATEVQPAAVCVLGSPILFPNALRRRVAFLKYVLPYTDQTDRTTLPDLIRTEQTRRGEPALGRVRYNRWSSRAVEEVFRLADTVDAKLPSVRAPLLLLYATRDDTAPPPNDDHIAKRVGSSLIERHLLETSGHILPQDVERERVFDITADFIRRHAATHPASES